MPEGGGLLEGGDGLYSGTGKDATADASLRRPFPETFWRQCVEEKSETLGGYKSIIYV